MDEHRGTTLGNVPDHYCPRRPDFADVDCGFTTTTGGCDTGFVFASGMTFPGTPFGFGEKSGIPRGPFFFMSPPGMRAGIFRGSCIECLGVGEERKGVRQCSGAVQFIQASPPEVVESSRRRSTSEATIG